MRQRRVFGAIIGAAAAVAFLPSGANAACTLTYRNGSVLSNVDVVQVNWGSGVRADQQAFVPAFYAAVVGSTYLDWLSEYDTPASGTHQFIGRGSFRSSTTITPSLTATTLSDTQIGTELAAQIQAGKVPGPTFDGAGNVDTMYSIDFPPGLTITQPGGASCVQFCGTVTLIVVGGKSVPVALFPDIGAGSACAGGCGTATNYLDNVSAVHSGIMLLAITDPGVADASGTTPLGWYADQSGADFCGNVNDICNQQTATVGAYVVNKGWSNKANACVASAPAMPICAGALGSSCRGCTKSDDGTGCTGATPVCDTAPASATYGLCTAGPARSDGGGGDGATDASATDANEAADRPPFDAAGTPDAGGGGTCVPGQQVACACVGGGTGAQACLASGAGYGACQCPDAGTAPAKSSSGCGCTLDGTGGGRGGLPNALLLLAGAGLARRRRNARR